VVRAGQAISKNQSSAQREEKKSSIAQASRAVEQRKTINKKGRESSLQTGKEKPVKERETKKGGNTSLKPQKTEGPPLQQKGEELTENRGFTRKRRKTHKMFVDRVARRGGGYEQIATRKEISTGIVVGYL